MQKIHVKYQTTVLVQTISRLDYNIVHGLGSDTLAASLLERQYMLEACDARELVRALRRDLSVAEVGFGKVEVRAVQERLLELDVAVYDHVHYLYSLEIPLKVPAIRLVRGLSGLGLREAKEMADYIGDHPRV